MFHNEQFRESYSEAAKRVFESFKTNLGDSSPFQQVNPENIQRAYFIEPDFYRYPIDICDDVLYTLYILPGHEPGRLACCHKVEGLNIEERIVYGVDHCHRKTE